MPLHIKQPLLIATLDREGEAWVDGRADSPHSEDSDGLIEARDTRDRDVLPLERHRGVEDAVNVVGCTFVLLAHPVTVCLVTRGRNKGGSQS